MNVEEKLFRRLSKRLLAHDSILHGLPQAPPTPPPDNTDANEQAEGQISDPKTQQEERDRWRDDTFLDFSAFESNLIRAQLLINSNQQERERYAAERERITHTAAAVREKNALLHSQLEDAQKTLALRKTYDQLAEKITSNSALKPRDELHAQLDKLNAEIAQLEKESSDYALTWSERRDQFGKIVDEGMHMLRLIRDEKEEAERKEGMDVDDDAQTADASRAATPKPADESATKQFKVASSTVAEAQPNEHDIEEGEEQEEPDYMDVT